MSALVWIIPGFACFDKYYIMKGIKGKQKGGKRDCDGNNVFRERI